MMPAPISKNPASCAKLVHELSHQFKSDLQLVLTDSIQAPGVKGTVTIFGSSRVQPGDPLYIQARDLGRCLCKDGWRLCSGGGPGFMQAFLEGADGIPGEWAIGVQPKFLAEAEGSSQGDRITRHFVHSMHSRKFVMAANSSALIFYPGGLGTMDELLDFMALMQLGQMKKVPIICMGDPAFWGGFFDWVYRSPVMEGLLNRSDLDPVYFASDAKQVLRILELPQAQPPKFTASDIARMAKFFENDLLAGFGAIDQLHHPSFTLLGSARVKPGQLYYESARCLAYEQGVRGSVLYTGGGSGIMEAGHLGSQEAKSISYGFLPEFLEKLENPDISNRMQVRLHLMSSRKLFLGMSDALVFYPGGIGTLDEFFEYAVRVQINDMEQKPLVLMHRAFWDGLCVWMIEQPLAKGYISFKDLGLFTFANGPQEAIEHLQSR